MPRSARVKGKHPLIIRLLQICHSLERLATVDREMRREAKKCPYPLQRARIESFYQGAIQSGTMTVRLLKEAIRLFPIAPQSKKGSKS
jgi:hypothetical protein